MSDTAPAPKPLAIKVPRNAPQFVRSALAWMRSAGPYLGVVGVFLGYTILLLEAVKSGCEKAHALSVDQFGSSGVDADDGDKAAA